MRPGLCESRSIELCNNVFFLTRYDTSTSPQLSLQSPNFLWTTHSCQPHTVENPARQPFARQCLCTYWYCIIIRPLAGSRICGHFGRARRHLLEGTQETFIHWNLWNIRLMNFRALTGFGSTLSSSLEVLIPRVRILIFNFLQSILHNFFGKFIPRGSAASKYILCTE